MIEKATLSKNNQRNNYINIKFVAKKKTKIKVKKKRFEKRKKEEKIDRNYLLIWHW